MSRARARAAGALSPEPVGHLDPFLLAQGRMPVDAADGSEKLGDVSQVGRAQVTMYLDLGSVHQAQASGL